MFGFVFCLVVVLVLDCFSWLYFVCLVGCFGCVILFGFVLVLLFCGCCVGVGLLFVFVVLVCWVCVLF